MRKKLFCNCQKFWQYILCTERTLGWLLQFLSQLTLCVWLNWQNIRLLKALDVKIALINNALLPSQFCFEALARQQHNIWWPTHWMEQRTLYESSIAWKYSHVASIDCTNHQRHNKEEIRYNHDRLSSLTNTTKCMELHRENMFVGEGRGCRSLKW